MTKHVESASDEDIPKPTTKWSNEGTTREKAEVRGDESSIIFQHTKSSGPCDTTIKAPALRRKAFRDSKGKDGDKNAFGYRDAKAFNNTFMRGNVENEVSRESEREKRG